jgi:uncharacterized membrane protein YbhN (UPF0104 family)
LFASAIALLALRTALRGLDWAAFRSHATSLSWRWLLLAVLFDVASYLLQALRWRTLLGDVSLSETTKAVYAGLFLNEVVPLRPGEAVRAWWMSRHLRRSLLAIAPTILTERLMDGLWLAAALLVLLSLAPLPPSVSYAGWAFIAFVGILLLLSPLLANRVRFVRQVHSSLANLAALAASGAFLAAQGFAFWAVTRASHLSVGVAGAFAVMLIVRLGTMFPLAPANLGAHQLSSVLALTMLGVPRPAAAAFSIVVFVVLTAPLLTIGFLVCATAGFKREIIAAATTHTRLPALLPYPGAPTTHPHALS